MPAEMAAPPESENWNVIYSWSRGFLAFHESMTVASVVPWSSPDGLAWTKGSALDVAGLSGVGIAAVAEGPAGLVAVGYVPGCADDGTGCMPSSALAMWASADGRSWTRLDIARAFGGIGVGTVVGGPKGYMAISTDTASTENRPAVWFSTNGRDWRGGRLPDDTFANSALSRGLVLGSGYLLEGRVGSLEGLGGGYFPMSTPAMWWSSDGSKWTAVELKGAASAPAAEALVTALGKGKLIASVVSWDSPTQIDGVTSAWTSTDGRTWTLSARSFVGMPMSVSTDGKQAIRQLQTASDVPAFAISADGFGWAEVPWGSAGPDEADQLTVGPPGILLADMSDNLWLGNIMSAH
jgi:hypothetical protein